MNHTLNNIHCLLLLIVFIFLPSCSQSEQSNFSCFDIECYKDAKVIDAKDIDLSVKNFGTEKGVYLFSDIFSDVKYIPLEATEESSIGAITKIEKTKEGDYIIFCFRQKSILRFDSTGHFLNAIGALGKSKSEYIDPTDICYDPFNNQVAVADRSNKCIKFYNLDGSFCEVVKLNYFFFSCGVINKNLFVTYNQFREKPESGEIAYNLKVHNRKGQLIKQYEPYGIERKGFRDIYSETFKMQNQKLICNEHHLPLIFTFEQEVLVPLYRLDFGKQAMSIDVLLKNISPKERLKWEKENDIIYCEKFYELDTKYVMLLRVAGTKGALFIQDKKDKTKQFAKFIGRNDMTGAIATNCFLGAHGNCIIFEADPYSAQQYLELIQSDKDRAELEKKRGPISESDIEILKKLSSHTNTIIQICELKK